MNSDSVGLAPVDQPGTGSAGAACTPPPPAGRRGRRADGTGGPSSRRRSRSNGRGRDLDMEPIDLVSSFGNLGVSTRGGHCPVRGCYCADGSGHPGWSSEQGLKAH
eukprot:5208182-Karenia_brevis.AAC.1